MSATADRPVTRPLRVLETVVVLQLALFVCLGLPDGALGVAWPTMRASFGRASGDLGWVLAAGTVGYLIASTQVVRLTRRTGSALAMAGAAFGMAVAMAGWAVVSVWALLLVASFALGLSRGALDTGLNAHVALHGDVRRMGLLHASYGVGSTIGPLVVLASLNLGGGWRGALVALAVTAAVLGALTLRSAPRWPDEHLARASAADAHPNVHAGRIPVVIVVLSLVTFAALVGAEYSMGAWSYTLLTDGRGVDDNLAGIAVATFWAGLTIGRFGMGWLGHRVRPLPLLHTSGLVALAGALWLLADPFGTGALGLPVAGLGFAALFPTLVLLMPARVGAERAPSLIGWSIACSSLGGTAVAAGLGAIADRRGAGSLAWGMAIVTAAFVAFELLLTRAAPTRPAGTVETLDAAESAAAPRSEPGVSRLADNADGYRPSP